MQFGCSNGRDNSINADTIKGLKDHYQSYFPIGVAVDLPVLNGDQSDLILKHFNSVTAENAMKMKRLQPKENQFYWKDADSIANYARRHKLLLRGHTLAWHEETPHWLFIDSTGKQASKELVLQRLKNHITAVVNRYKDVVYAWDVVNEAISNNEDEYYRRSRLFEICGEDFIWKAFEYAHAADPKALLFYNDYNETKTVKRKKIISLIQKMKSAGVPIHGVGLQAHWSIEEINSKVLDQTLKDFSALGLPIQVTELDLSIYPKSETGKKIDTGFTKSKADLQAKQYKMIFNQFRKYRQHITGVTFWNVSDRKSWLDNFPVKERKDYPLLFDEYLEPKKAYWEVVNFD